MYRQISEARVRYGETDQMGYVYYGNYALYFEVGRVECMRSLGISYKWMESQGIHMPVLDLNCKYYQPARYDDLIRIETRITEMPASRIRFEYSIMNEAGVLLTEGTTKLAFLSATTGKPVRSPEKLREVLTPFFP